MSKEKSNSKYLYTCESEINAYECIKMAKYFPQIYFSYVKFGTLLNVFLVLILLLILRNLLITLVFFILFQIIIMIIYKIKLGYLVERSITLIKKKKNIDTKVDIEFYDNYLIKSGKTKTCKVNYSFIDKCIETDTNFYLKCDKENLIIIIQKNKCELELINFIRKKFKNLETHLKDNSKFKGVKKYHNPNFIKKIMLILFVITISSLFLALYIIYFINQNNQFSFIKYMWIFWCFLPVPILSIILGFKYKKAGFKCTKNIIGGFIIVFLLLGYGSFSMIFNFSQDYDMIDKYRNIIDADLPSNGELEIQNWDTYFDEDKTDYTIINIYYSKEDVSDLVNSIKNNNTWILSKDIKSPLKIFVPSVFRSSNDVYYSIYNKTTNQYNTLPEKASDYLIYAMKYDISDKHLEIHKFKYTYK